MNTRKYLAPFLALVLTFTFMFATAAPAMAACSYQGYISSQGKCAQSYDNKYNWSYQNRDRYYEQRTEAIRSMIERLEAMISYLESQLDDYDRDDAEVRVVTRSAVDVEEDTATLRSRLYLNGEDEAEVWFQYGETRSNLNRNTDKETIDEDDSVYFEAEIDNLDEDSLYYYRAVAEDEDNDKDYGSIYSFRTDEDGEDSDEPTLNTKEATDVTDDSAELRGYVDMNDFNNGIVFFVYGENEDDVEDIAADYDTYAEIDEDGDDLQKVRVDTDLDNSANYTEEVSDLDNNSDIYYSICVEYEDEDDDETIACGDVEEFETDE